MERPCGLGVVWCVLLLVCACGVVGVSSKVVVAKIIASSSSVFFLANVSVGTPPQALSPLLFDISYASFPWTLCSPPPSSPATFYPSSSSSFHSLHRTLHLPPSHLSGKLASDTFSLHLTNGTTLLPPSLPLPRVQFACVAARAKNTIPGVASFSSLHSSLPAQFAAHGLARKFSYCLPSTPGNPGPFFFGSGVDYRFGAPASMNISAFLAFATLIRHKDGFYELGLQAILVDATNLKIHPQTLQLSTVQRYTTLTSPVYSKLRETFKAKAALRNIAAVPPVAPFDTCFNVSTIPFSRVGYAVPEIDLQLQPNVTWAFFGFSSIVSVSDSVVCLAFLDAGPSQPSVVGTFQQQDNMIEIDLDKSRFGFSGILYYFRTTCADANVINP